MRIAGETLGQGAVAEDALDRGLGVVEVAFHGGHLHVGAGLRGHLQLLDLGDLAFRVEDGDRGARGVREAGQRALPVSPEVAVRIMIFSSASPSAGVVCAMKRGRICSATSLNAEVGPLNSSST